MTALPESCSREPSSSMGSTKKYKGSYEADKENCSPNEDRRTVNAGRPLSELDTLAAINRRPRKAKVEAYRQPEEQGTVPALLLAKSTRRPRLAVEEDGTLFRYQLSARNSVQLWLEGLHYHPTDGPRHASNPTTSSSTPNPAPNRALSHTSRCGRPPKLDPSNAPRRSLRLALKSAPAPAPNLAPRLNPEPAPSNAPRHGRELAPDRDPSFTPRRSPRLASKPTPSSTRSSAPRPAPNRVPSPAPNRAASPTRKRWTIEEDELIEGVLSTKDLEQLHIGTLCQTIYEEHGPNGSKSRVLATRTKESIRVKVRTLLKILGSSKQSRLEHKPKEWWPSPQEEEECKARGKHETLQFINELQAGTYSSEKPQLPSQLAAILTFYRVSNKMPVDGHVGLKKNASICRDVFLDDTGIKTEASTVTKFVGFAPNFPSSLRWDNAVEESTPTAQMTKNFMDQVLQPIHDAVPENERRAVVLLVPGIDGLTTTADNMSYLQERFLKLDMILVLMAGWRQICNPRSTLLKHWWFPATSRFAYGFYPVDKLAQAARDSKIRGPSRDLLVAWGLISDEKKHNSKVDMMSTVGVTPRYRNSIGQDWIKWSLKKHRCGLCLYTAVAKDNMLSHWTKNHMIPCTTCGEDAHRRSVKTFATPDEWREHMRNKHDAPTERPS